MAKTYLKEWRQHRGLTQDEVIGRLVALDDPSIPRTAASLSRLENGKQIYTQRSMEALAAIYDCDAGDLHHPPPPNDDLSTMLRGMDDLARARAARLLRAMDETLAEKAGLAPPVEKDSAKRA